MNKISWLSENLPTATVIPLKGEFSDLYKLRVGEWRVIFSPDHVNKTIYIYKIGHRKDIYR
jgi:mRNA interferase RelE/StbE